MAKEPTPRQINFIQKLVVAKQQALTPAPDWLKPPKTALDASNLINKLTRLPDDPVVLTEDDQPKVDKMEKVRSNLSAIQSSLRYYAESFLTQWDNKKRLSDNQWALVDKMIEQIDNPQVEVHVEAGFYLLDNNDVVMAYLTRNKFMSTKTYTHAENRWVYTGKASLKLCEPERKMTGEQVAALGRRISGDGKGMCVVCLAEGRDPTLTDDRSIAVGYGPVCANRFGWHYPSKDEAEAILNSRTEQTV